ncbi:hypothetical protein [Luteibacter sp. Lutesp34]|uniref:hypothetical protein n=1 Tax=Luteibacter sp. Lutesp34 TaxID=3243030 RepID=UPI0039B3BC52
MTFKRLWLASERDSKGRVIDLPNRLLLLGPNGTGKSRIVKSLFWAFGVEPMKWRAGTWDTDTMVGLEFALGQDAYMILRNKKELGLFRGDGFLLFCTRKRSEWDARMGELFGYHLRLQRPSGDKSAQASLEYLLLPSYLDQDGSWGSSWTTFLNLTQFKAWKPAAFEAFIGERPNAYFVAKHLRDEVLVVLNQKRRDYEAHTEAFRRVNEALPADLPTLDPLLFRNELAELGALSTATYNKQATARGKLMATLEARERLRTELALVTSAYRELNADSVYLTELPEGAVECPTCGTQHENSFHARLQLSEDVDTMSALVAELRQQVVNLDDEVDSLTAVLSEVQVSLEEISRKTASRRADLELADVLAAHSKKALDAAFVRISDGLKVELGDLDARDVELRSRLRALDNPNRKRQVREYYAEQVAKFSQVLNVPSDEQVGRVKVGERAQAGGSSAPRSMLAVHLALLRTNVEFGDSPRFPFVVDTPQQSGQDGNNLRRMIDVLLPAVGSDHQVILAVEALPDGVDVSGYEILNLDTPHGALRRDEFSPVAAKLSEFLRAMHAALAS